MKLFVTFCKRKVRFHKKGYVGFYDTETKQWRMVNINKRGFQGACFDKGGVWLAGYKKIYYYKNLRSNPVITLRNRKFSGLHSITKRGNELLIVSAGNNCVYSWDGKRLKIKAKCGEHPNTINGNFITCLNKHDKSRVYDMKRGVWLSDSKWYLSHNYTPYKGGYVILNGDGSVISNGKILIYYACNFLRGLLIKNDTAYIGMNVFMDINHRDYRPPQIAVFDFNKRLTSEIIKIPIPGKNWTIYDILEYPE